MAFRIDEFVGALPGGGARPNLFEVTIATPSGIDPAPNMRFLVQASSIPGATIGITTLNYFGREVKVAGSKTFEDWTTTIINDEDFAIRRILEVWQENILGNSSNVRGIGKTTPSSYKGSATVKQFGKGGAAIREYKIENIWPTAIAEIGLDWSSNDEVETFDCTWAYSHWESQDSGDALGITIQTPIGAATL
tara:strand:+ start:612 stop:1190 length:579 start_codon:yes stop_codon:yes gene_type:complete